MKPLCLVGFLLAVLFISGCQGTGEIVKLRVQHLESEVDSQGSPLTIAVSPFDDQRQSTEYLGTRTRQGRSPTYFDVMNGTLSQEITSSFVEFLKQAGFVASPANGNESTDLKIDATIHKFAVQANGSPLFTSLEVDTVIAFVVHNAADKSTVRVSIGVGETGNQVACTAGDMEKFIGQVLAESFEEFLEKTEVQGQTLKFRLPEKTS